MKPEHLAYWIEERERIRELKEAGAPKPWSEDAIFQTTYFCNVRREDDKVTKWVRKNWPCGGSVGLVVLARMFNLPEHLEELLDVFRIQVWIVTGKHCRSKWSGR